MLPTAGLHDSTVRVGKVVLRLGIGCLTGRGLLRTARLFACFALGLPLGLLGFVLFLLRRRHLMAPLLNDLPSLFQRRHPILSPRQFGWNVQSLLGFGGLGLLGTLYRLLYFQFPLLAHLPGSLVTYGRMLAGVGLDFGSIHADRTHFGEL